MLWHTTTVFSKENHGKWIWLRTKTNVLGTFESEFYGILDVASPIYMEVVDYFSSSSRNWPVAGVFTQHFDLSQTLRTHKGRPERTRANLLGLQQQIGCFKNITLKLIRLCQAHFTHSVKSHGLNYLVKVIRQLDSIDNRVAGLYKTFYKKYQNVVQKFFKRGKLLQ